MELPKEVKNAIGRLEAAGYEAFAVGGCVRDSLLGNEPGDYDLTTAAKPEETKRVFQGEKIVETGIKHGTVTVILGETPLEITTFRVESEYRDNRRPERVEFTKSIEEDLARRDFTMNALAYSESRGIVDPFGGEADVKAGIIRAVGDPEKRFREDALRIMRALRFASALGFEIEPETEKALLENRALLLNVSAERLSEELLKLLCGQNVRRVLMKYTDVLGVILPELLPMRGFDQRNPHHVYDVLEHSAAAAEKVPPRPALRLGALLHDVGKPRCFTIDENGVGHFYGHAEISARMAEEILGRLRLDSAAKKEVVSLVKYHGAQIEPTAKSVRRALNKYSPELFFELLLLKRADAAACDPGRPLDEEYFSALERLGKEIIAEKQCFSLKDLAVKGGDLVAAGFAPGPKLGAVLKLLLDKVINGELPNEREKLLDFAKTLL